MRGVNEMVLPRRHNRAALLCNDSSTDGTSSLLEKQVSRTVAHRPGSVDVVQSETVVVLSGHICEDVICAN